MRAFLLASFASAAVVLVAACSSTPTARAFDDDAGDPATQQPEQNSAPPDAGGGGPVVVTGNDAGPDGDGSDDCATTAPSNKCGLIAQCGCASPQTCDVIDSTGDVDCVTAGVAAVGAPCVNTSGCAKGLTCTFGTCHAFCNDPGGACTGANTDGCLAVEDTTNAVIPNLDICRVACDPRDANACGGTTAAGVGVCMVDDTGHTDCQAGGTATVGATCNDTVMCGPALVCAGPAGGTNTCKKWCKVGSTDCGGTTACAEFNPKIMVGTTEYGECP